MSRDRGWKAEDQAKAIEVIETAAADDENGDVKACKQLHAGNKLTQYCCRSSRTSSTMRRARQGLQDPMRWSSRNNRRGNRSQNAFQSTQPGIRIVIRLIYTHRLVTRLVQLIAHLIFRIETFQRDVVT